MDERVGRSIIHVGSPVFFAALASVPVLYLQDQPGLMLTMLGVLYGCGGIGSIIRWINLRADHRRAKRPPDPP